MDEKKLFPAPLKTTRREFIKAAGLASTALALPTFIPASALGRDGAVAPSERIRVGGIGLGNQGGGDFGGFLGSPDVQYLAVCDVRKNVRDGKKAQVDERYKSKDCAAYNDFRELLARDGYRRGARRHAGPLAHAHRDGGLPARQGRVLPEAGDADPSRRPADGGIRAALQPGCLRGKPARAGGLPRHG